MQRASSGYTLIELLLVLALVVLAVALVAPAVLEGGSRSELEDAADKLANMWASARLDAITSGQTLLFRCQPGAGEASVGGVDSLLTPQSQQAELPGDAPAAAPTQQLTLSNVTFLSLTVAEPPGGEPVLYQESASAGGCIIVFRPDGAASDAEAVLQHADGGQLRVTLRGLTGATRVEEVDAETGGG